MGFFSSRGPDERRNDGAQQRQYERDLKKIKAGDAKAERINRMHSARTNDARRQGR